MKKLMVLMVFVVAIGLIGCDSKSPQKNVKDDNTPKAAMYLTSNVTCEDIIQSEFPKLANNFYREVGFFNGIWIGMVVANLPEEDLLIFTEKLNLILTPNLLEIWPEALDCKEEKFENFRRNFWDLTSNSNDLYYFEYPDEFTRIMLKYENGKIYFKRETEYSTIIGQDGTLLHQKVKK